MAYIASFLTLKLLAYTGWCALGSQLRCDAGARWKQGILLGALRLTLGLAAGALAIIACNGLRLSSATSIAVAVLIWLTLRLCNWSIILWRISRTAPPRPIAPSKRGQLCWLLGAMLLSLSGDGLLLWLASAC